ncbi:hypothetical protein DKX38_026347 [Salix brachista]|uniref:Uncharacterized protein n=1 Tax=Salix brachista TaxID=2182728 RepID=A0A5N5J9H3_9ROSI|nr:hypothetical protein DKX38_026339 [Salix brachista]KAB5515699.1 hypothetical protein DKX38_026347 [Salix brachista]
MGLIGPGDVLLVSKTVVLKVEMLQAESLKKVLPGVKTVEEGCNSPEALITGSCHVLRQQLAEGLVRTESLKLTVSEKMERLRVSTGDLVKFTLEFHVNQTLEFNLGLSKNFRINLLEEDPNDMSCHCPVKGSEKPY